VPRTGLTAALALLETLPIEQPAAWAAFGPSSSGGGSQQQQQQRMPEAGDVLLYCRSGSGIGGLPELEKLLVLGVQPLLAEASPRQTAKRRCAGRAAGGSQGPRLA
jgi:hypothetical protein